MSNKCCYCETRGNTPHLDGCPHKIYREVSDQLFSGATSDVEIVFTAISRSGKDIDRKTDEAITQFEHGYEDGWKAESARKPSEHPSYKLGLRRAVSEALECEAME